ncbi:MAG: hypothetical protein ACT4NX_06095 [Deltaproteobacteria bacterium]
MSMGQVVYYYGNTETPPSGSKEMTREKKRRELIRLTFNLESDASLWSVVFKGFDEEVVLMSRFEGRNLEAIRTLHRFGIMIEKQYQGCKVEIDRMGLVIKKTLLTNDLAVIRNWTELMYSVREEMANIVGEELGI